jgi:hypothetical protein
MKRSELEPAIKSSLLADYLLRKSFEAETKKVSHELNFANTKYDLTEQIQLKHFFKIICEKTKDFQVIVNFVDLLIGHAKMATLKSYHSWGLKITVEYEYYKLHRLFSCEGGIDLFITNFVDSNDFCAFNTERQLDIILYTSLLKNSCAEILYAIYLEKLLLPKLDPVVTSKDNMDLFPRKIINSTDISPLYMIQAIQDEFVNAAGEIKRPHWEFLEREFGLKKDVVRDILSKKEGSIDKNLAELLSYLILKQELPELIEYSYLDSFKDKCEKILTEVAEKSIPSTELNLPNWLRIDLEGQQK